MINKELADEKVGQGWIRVWAMIEVLGIKEEITKKSLETHIDTLDMDERVKLYKKQLGEIKEVEKPLKNVEKGFSQVCEIEFIAKNLEDLVAIIMKYGPSAVEILEPNEIKLKMNESQNILNLVSRMMHEFAAAGIGGLVIANK